MQWTQLGSSSAPFQLVMSEIIYVPGNSADKVSAKIFMFGGETKNREPNYQLFMYDLGKFGSIHACNVSAFH